MGFLALLTQNARRAAEQTKAIPEYPAAVKKPSQGEKTTKTTPADNAPHSPEEAFHPRFVEALQKQAHVEYLLDVLLFGETEEKAVLIMDYGKDVIQLEQRMAELAAADAARTKKHHERHAAAPER